MAKLKENSKAPDFKLLNQRDEEVSLSDFRGTKVLVYFYPKADTPGCTKQACNVRDALSDLRKKDVEVIGISPDQPGKQLKFDTKHGLGFHLLSDPESKVAKKWGAWGTKKMYGKEYEGIVRSSFMVDEDGIVIQANYKVKPDETADKARQALKAKK